MSHQATASLNRLMSSLSWVWLLIANCFGLGRFSPQGFAFWKLGPSVTALKGAGALRDSMARSGQVMCSTPAAEGIDICHKTRSILRRVERPPQSWVLLHVADAFLTRWDMTHPVNACQNVATCYLDLLTTRILSQINTFTLDYSALDICNSDTNRLQTSLLWACQLYISLSQCLLYVFGSFP